MVGRALLIYRAQKLLDKSTSTSINSEAITDRQAVRRTNNRCFLYLGNLSSIKTQIVSNGHRYGHMKL